VNRFAGVLKSLAVGGATGVTIYLPMVPEAVISMLACARSAPPTRSSSAASRPIRAGAHQRLASKVLITATAATAGNVVR
jgi:acyl-coenzyme A synthetase/AMP-(fatty) acid ligase